MLKIMSTWSTSFPNAPQAAAAATSSGSCRRRRTGLLHRLVSSGTMRRPTMGRVQLSRSNHVHRPRPPTHEVLPHRPPAAFTAIHGEVERETLCAIVAASDGATRGHQLLGIQSPRDLVAAVGTGGSAAVIAAIRYAERESHALEEQGFKQHDDATLIAATFDRKRGHLDP